MPYPQGYVDRALQGERAICSWFRHRRGSPLGWGSKEHAGSACTEQGCGFCRGAVLPEKVEGSHVVANGALIKGLLNVREKLPCMSVYFAVTRHVCCPRPGD